MNAPEPQDYLYSERDVILYNLSIGATEQELRWTFENHEDFAALPTFGVVPQFMSSSGIPLDFLPNFNPVRCFFFRYRTIGPTFRFSGGRVIVSADLIFLLGFKAKLLHGEQFLSIKAPIPISGNLVNEAR